MPLNHQIEIRQIFSVCMYVWQYHTIPPNLSTEWCEKHLLGPKPPNLMTANISSYTVYSLYSHLYNVIAGAGLGLPPHALRGE